MSGRIRYLSLCALCLVAVACGSSTQPSTPPTGNANLRILFTSDEHSHFFASSPELDDYPYATTPGSGLLKGGVARRATILKEQRTLATDNGLATLTLSSGDSSFGALPEITFRSGSISYEIMHDLGYVATTFGNHEFDLGPAALADALNAAEARGKLVPIVASNIHFSASDPRDDTLAALFSEDPTDDKPIHRYRVITLSNGLRVGLVGYLGVNASYDAPNKAPVTFSERGVDPANQDDPDVVLPKLYADLQPVVDEVRSKADVVVALAHAGVSKVGDVKDSEDYRIAQNVSGIDVILSGHSHRAVAGAIDVKNTQTGRNVVVLSAGYYGYQLGRVDLRVSAGTGDQSTAATDTSSTPEIKRVDNELISVDDKTLPDPDVVAATPAILDQIEKAPAKDGKSYLGELLGRVDGLTEAVSAPGALYFKKLAHTSFNVTNTHALMFMTADADLEAADAIEHTDVALQSAGQIFGVLAKGKTGNISAADAFSVVPLGSSPDDDTLGYPLVRVYLGMLYIRAIFEIASTLSKTNDSYDLTTAGMRVQYDCSRPPVEEIGDLFRPDKGRVMKIYLDTDHSDGLEQFDKVIYDRKNNVSLDGPYSIVATSYIAQFAGDLGIPLVDKDGNQVSISDAILHRHDGSEVKELEAFFNYLHHGLGGEVPATYNPDAAGATQRFAGFAPCGG